jgi:TonB family protein
MTLPRILTVLLGLVLAGSGLISAQDQPLAAGSDGVPVPKKKKFVQPVYPPEALAKGIRGIVILDLVIDTEGRVVDTSLIRSIPGLDEAALVAARKWVYEPVVVDGKPVSVRLTVPITFALKLPEMNRVAGIPELRQGVKPPWPEGVRSGRGVAVADVTLEPDGRIGLARIIEGEEPWSTSLLQALRTWRFRAPRGDATVSFSVTAEFTSERDEGRVALSLNDLRESSLLPVGTETAESGPPPEVEMPPAAPAEVPQAEPTPETETPEPEPDAAEAAGVSPTPEPPAEAGAATAPTEAEPETQPEVEATEPSPPQGPEGGEPPASEPPTAVAEARTEPTLPATPEPTPTPSEPETASPPSAAPAADAEGAPATEGPAAATSGSQDAAGNETAGGPATAGQAVPPPPPPVEVLSVAPPPLPPENGISAIRGVDLDPGVPDLTRGRRPVSPPFARMQGASGEVTVEFSVSAGGITTVQRVTGPEILQPAARGAVESWVFRRTRADRAYLVATFTYEDDLASAIVRPQSSQ